MVFKKNTKVFFNNNKINLLIVPSIFVFTFLLVFISKVDSLIISKIKNTSSDIITPISYVVTYPFNNTVKFVNGVNNLKKTYTENKRLKEEIYRLKQWQTLSLRLIDENKAYKKLLNVEDVTLELKHTVRVLTQTPSIYIHAIQLSAGSNKNINNNSIIINERGLVGRIIEVGKFTSKALLINDINANIPVKVFNQDIHAIVTGHPSNKYLIVKFIKDNVKLRVGQILVTSGNAELYPKNIAVGKIFSTKNDQVLVRPFVNLNNLNFVQIVNKK